MNALVLEKEFSEMRTFIFDYKFSNVTLYKNVDIS